MLATVVELRLVDMGKMKTVARFVLLQDGRVEVVPVSFAREDVQALVPDPIASPSGMVSTSDGGAYLDALRGMFNGDYMWATDPFDMELDVARATASGT